MDVKERYTGWGLTDEWYSSGIHGQTTVIRRFCLRIHYLILAFHCRIVETVNYICSTLIVGYWKRYQIQSSFSVQNGWEFRSFNMFCPCDPYPNGPLSTLGGILERRHNSFNWFQCVDDTKCRFTMSLRIHNWWHKKVELSYVYIEIQTRMQRSKKIHIEFTILKIYIFETNKIKWGILYTYNVVQTNLCIIGITV